MSRPSVDDPPVARAEPSAPRVSLYNRALGLLRHGVIQNMIALFGVQVFRKVLPVITMPYLGRVLGPGGLGLVAFVQGYSVFVTLAIEYGFNLSATRELARCRESKERRAHLMGGVLGAQAAFALLSVAVSLLISRTVPMLRDHPALVISGLIFAVSDACNPYWYFQGMERMRFVAGLEIAAKVAAAAGIFALVRAPEDAWMVMALQAAASILSTSVALAIALGESGMRRPSRLLVMEAIQMGWPMFLFRSADTVYALGNAFVLGLFVSPVLVGYYAGSEKISKAFFGVMNPIREALYPRLSKLVKESESEAARLARLGVIVMGSGGLLLGALVFFLAPYLVRVLLGAQFAAAVPVLRILSLLPPLMAVTHSVGFQWLLPLGKNDVINKIMLSAGLFNFTLAVILAPRYAHIGMAWAVVTSEAFLCLRMVYAVTRMQGSQQFFRKT